MRARAAPLVASKAGPNHGRDREAGLKAANLRRQAFEAAIIARYRRRDSAVVAGLADFTSLRDHLDIADRSTN